MYSTDANAKAASGMYVNVRGNGSRAFSLGADPANAQGNILVPANGSVFVTLFYQVYVVVDAAGTQSVGPGSLTMNFTVVSPCSAYLPGRCNWDSTIPGNEAFSGVAVSGRTDNFNVTAKTF